MRRAHDKRDREKAECFARCWELKTEDTFIMLGLGKLPGKAGLIGMLPISPASGLAGEDWGGNAFDYTSTASQSAGIGADYLAKEYSIPMDARGHQWKTQQYKIARAADPGLSRRDWYMATKANREIKATIASKAAKAANMAGNAFTAMSLGYEYMECLNKCEKCPSQR